MSSSSSDQKSFAIFVNSKSATRRTTTKSVVTIPFVSNLVNFDPMKNYKLSIIDVLFPNVFYNIRPNYNILKVLIQMAAGRGLPASYELKTIEVPYGFYDFDTLASYLRNECGTTTSAQPFDYGTLPVQTNDIFEGFGATPTAAGPVLNETTIDGVVSNPTFAKLLFQSAQCGQMYQYGTNLTAVAAGNTKSFVYQGVYLLVDSDTIPLMTILGFYNSTFIVPTIPNQALGLKGYGYSLQARTTNGANAPATNNVTYDIYNQDGTSHVCTGPADTYKAVVTPTLVSDLSGLDELYVHCDQLRTYFHSSQNRQPLGPSDVVAVIPVSVPFGQQMIWNPQFPLECALANTNISQLDFRLTNSNNELLDFNGMDWSMTMYLQESDDSSHYNYVSNGTQATPFQMQHNNLDAGSFLQERRSRKRVGMLAGLSN